MMELCIGHTFYKAMMLLYLICFCVGNLLLNISIHICIQIYILICCRSSCQPMYPCQTPKIHVYVLVTEGTLNANLPQLPQIQSTFRRSHITRDNSLKFFIFLQITMFYAKYKVNCISHVKALYGSMMANLKLRLAQNWYSGMSQILPCPYIVFHKIINLRQ